MTKSKTWEEEFLKTKFMSDGGARFECTDYEEMQVELHDFIASQIEKTRREAYEEGVKEGWSDSVQDALDKTDYESGLKAGLSRAIELVPKQRNTDDKWDTGYDYCRQEILENLKKEMEK